MNSIKPFGEELRELRNNTLFTYEEIFIMFPRDPHKNKEPRSLTILEMSRLLGISRSRYGQYEKIHVQNGKAYGRKNSKACPRIDRERAEDIATILKVPGHAWDCFKIISPKEATLDTPVEQLPWSTTRIGNLLRKSGITTCADLVATPLGKLKVAKQVGKKSLEEMHSMQSELRSAHWLIKSDLKGQLKDYFDQTSEEQLMKDIEAAGCLHMVQKAN